VQEEGFHDCIVLDMNHHSSIHRLITNNIGAIRDDEHMMRRGCGIGSYSIIHNTQTDKHLDIKDNI
jgi:hypothetical protein